MGEQDGASCVEFIQENDTTEPRNIAEHLSIPPGTVLFFLMAKGDNLKIGSD